MIRSFQKLATRLNSVPHSRKLHTSKRVCETFTTTDAIMPKPPKAKLLGKN